MVKILIEYAGDLHCQATHGPSGMKLETDAPIDNQGRGESFSPTDLVATALGSCMATVMGIYAKRHNVDLKGMQISVEKEMSQDLPRRISRLITQIEVPLAPDHPQRQALENSAHTCPVHKSLAAEIQKPITFLWSAIR